MPEVLARTYLGDGLYAEVDPHTGYYLRLYTLENNGVFLEDEVFFNLIKFVRKNKPEWLKESM